VVRCLSYDLALVRAAVSGVLAPLGGMDRFVRPGMRVLLKPNMLNDAGLDRATTTHPAVVQAVAEQVMQAGGRIWIGDSPGGSIAENPRVWRGTGIWDVAQSLDVKLVPFDRVSWQRIKGGNGVDTDYYIAPPVFEADLVIDLPKLKTHVLTLYTGAVKNLYGVIPGTRKREPHLRAPGVADFSEVLADVLQLVRPRLSILDGVTGLEGNGPGAGGTPRQYGLLGASTDPVALDAVVARALGCRPGSVIHLDRAEARGLGVAGTDRIEILGDRHALEFGRVELPRSQWYYHAPSWVSAPLRRSARVQPRLLHDRCVGCGRCIEVCPAGAIAREETPLDSSGRERHILAAPPVFDLDVCVGCLCCVEICPVGALAPRRNWIVRLLGMGR
jgi:uncharacterized protein (DUF362 family)/Pyruvate/2-oxoacid:ferredoxin oxidoreductase delta subunit